MTGREIYNFLSSQYSKRFCEGFYIIPCGSFKYMVLYQYTLPLLEDESGFIFTVGPRKLKLCFV